MKSKKSSSKPRARTASKVQNEFIPKEIQNEARTMHRNGLGEAIGFPGAGFPADQGTGWSVQLSQVNTLFKNNRWYLVSNMRQLLCELYVEHGLVQTIVDVPVDDGLRGGVEINSKQLSEEQIRDLQVSLDRDGDINTVGQAIKWNRLFGGAGVLIITDQDPSEPLDISAIDKDSPLEFRAVDMWELFWDKQNTEGYDPEIQAEDFEHYNYYAKIMHKSRVMRMKGLTAPSFIRPRLRGWGFSVVESLVRSINQYLKANDLSFEVLDEFKLDIFKIKNLTNTLLSPQGDQAVRTRVQMTNWQKNYQNAVVMDSEDDFDHKQLSFSGLAEVMAGIRMQIAADMRMPLTKLFGISAAGFNSGEDDIEVYNAMVESQVRAKAKYDILRVIEIKCQKLFGFIPDDIAIEFKPLRMLSAEQEENVKTQKFNRLMAAKSSMLINDFEFREACNRDNLLGIQLDNQNIESLNPDNPNIAEMVHDEDKKVTDVDDPGTNREDTRKPRLKDQTETKEGEGAGAAKQAPEAKQVKLNSIEYDLAAYSVDGGDEQFDPWHERQFENPGKVDESLWAKAKEASQKAFGKIKWQFVTWKYKQMGGKFG